MPAWMLIEHPTIGELAAALGQSTESSRVVTLQAGGSGMPIFVAHDKFGSLFGPRHYLTAIELDQPIYGLRAAAWEGRAVGDTLQEVAARSRPRHSGDGAYRSSDPLRDGFRELVRL